MHGTPAINKAKTHCLRGHPLSGDNVYLRTNGKRQCKACRNEKQNARRHAEKQDNLSSFVTW